MTKILCTIFLLGCAFLSFSQERIYLYEKEVPNSKPGENLEEDLPNNQVDTITKFVSNPSLTVYLPQKGKSNGTAVIIYPGGGYHVLLSKREGSDVAKKFNELGVTAFVLRYRLPDDRVMVDKSISPLQDAQAAMLYVRTHTKQWNLNPEKIGIMGYSAGGHLAATMGTHYEDLKINNPNGIKLRPDFLILVNPVISFTDSIGHIGSRDNLLGKNPSVEKIRYFSNELHVNSQTPASFLVHAGSDEVVSVKNSLSFYNRLLDNQIRAEMHIYGFGEHGFLTAPTFDEWFGRCCYWMKSMSLL